MVEFAIVVVLLIMLLYGIITYGLILAAQATLTQAAADAARAGIVASSTAGRHRGGPGQHRRGLDGQGDVRHLGHDASPACATESPARRTPTTRASRSTVTYNYSSAPLFPELPGLGVITPSTLSSTNVLQISTPSS